MLCSPFQNLLFLFSGDKKTEQHKLTPKVDQLLWKGLLTLYMQRVKLLCYHQLISPHKSRIWLEADDKFDFMFRLFQIIQAWPDL